ncbi:MAG: diacylglycerol kinase family protein [Kiritimatiellia bacterium]
MTLWLIMNPGSSSGRGRRLWAGWERQLRMAGTDYETCITRSMGHAFQLARDVPAHADTVVAVGGDGTINEVLDGVLQSSRPGLKMGVLYAGTSPDFCRFHGIPTDPAAALPLLLKGCAQKTDAVRITYSTADGSAALAHFGCGCNIGLGAPVARLSNRLRRFLGDRLGTAVAVGHALAVSHPMALEGAVDGESAAWPAVNNFSILKNPFMASGLRLNVSAEPDDGLLWLVAIQGKSRWGLCALLPAFYSGRAVEDSAVSIRACAHIRLSAREKCEIEFDGDPRGFLPAEIRILPGALNLIKGAA